MNEYCISKRRNCIQMSSVSFSPKDMQRIRFTSESQMPTQMQCSLLTWSHSNDRYFRNSTRSPLDDDASWMLLAKDSDTPLNFRRRLFTEAPRCMCVCVGRGLRDCTCVDVRRSSVPYCIVIPVEACVQLLNAVLVSRLNSHQSCGLAFDNFIQRNKYKSITVLIALFPNRCWRGVSL